MATIMQLFPFLAVIFLIDTLWGCSYAWIGSFLGCGTIWSILQWFPNRFFSYTVGKGLESSTPWKNLNKLACYYHLKVIQRKLPRLLIKYSHKSSDPGEMGLIITDHDTRMEQSTPLIAELEVEKLKLTAIGENGGVLIIQVLRLRDSKASFSLRWKAKNMSHFLSSQLNPEEEYEELKIDQSGQNQFRIGDLFLFVEEPFRKWRIAFNGLMRDESKQTVKHVRIDAIWSSLHNPYDWAKDSDMSSVAEDLAEANVKTIDELESIGKDFFNGIEQFGAVLGQFQDEDMDSEEEFYFRGSKNKVKTDMKRVVQESTFLGVSENGFHFVLKFGKVKDQLIVSGHLMVPGTTVKPMTNISVSNDLKHLVKVWDRKLLNPNEMFIRFEAYGRWFNVCITLKTQGSNIGSLTVIPCDITLNTRRGSGVFCLADTNENYAAMLSKIKADTFTDEIGQPYKIPLCMKFTNNFCTNTNLTGGKGASLAHLYQSQSRQGFAVPNGFVLTVKAFQCHLKTSQDIHNRLQDLEKISGDFKLSDLERGKKMMDKCESIQNIIKSTPMEDEIWLKVENCLEDSFGTDFWPKMRYAVRSSAVGEDSEDLSSAGQNETVLGCLGEEQIRKSVLKCWASCYSFHSTEYRRNNGQPIVTDMAVVIQEMVDADAAGVVFSRAASGNPREILISANYGLGESVVSSAVDPDEFTVTFEKSTGNFEINQRKVGTKDMKVVMSESGETGECENSQSDQPCLKDDVILKLAKMAKNLEHKYANPRDIEFAVKNGKIFMLQARPITSLNKIPDFIIEHEFDTGSASPEDVWTTANIGEIMPGTATPLTMDTSLKLVNFGICKSFYNFYGNKIEYTPCTRRLVGVAQYKCVLNYMDCILQAVPKDHLTKEIRAADLAVCGRVVCTNKDLEIAIDRRNVVSKWSWLLRTSSIMMLLLKNVFWQKTGLKDLIPLFKNLGHLETLSSKEVYDVIVSSLVTMFEDSYHHAITSSSSTTFQLIMFLTLSEGAEDWDSELYSDCGELLTDSNINIESAGVPEGIKKLQEELMSCSGIENFPKMSIEDAEQFLKSNSSYKNFIRRFQHRCYKELELSSVPWGEDASPIIETLQTIVALSLLDPEQSNKPDRTCRSAMEKLNQMKRTLKEDTKKKINFLMSYVLDAVALREQTKSNIIQRVFELRKVVQILGKRLQAEGKLPDFQLVYFLTLHELKQLTNENSCLLVKRSKLRRKIYKKCEDLHFEEMIRGVPRAMVQKEDFACTDEDGSILVKGTPVCKGIVKSTARVVMNLSEAKSIRKGDILITRCTDIGWSPYFPLLSGVVTELGGVISHGAVIAREYGLPCVVSAKGATTALKSGDLILLDGTTGELKKLKEIN